MSLIFVRKQEFVQGKNEKAPRGFHSWPIVRGTHRWPVASFSYARNIHIEGILPKGPYLACVSMAGSALLAGYYRQVITSSRAYILFGPVTHIWARELIVITSIDRNKNALEEDSTCVMNVSLSWRLHK